MKRPHLGRRLTKGTYTGVRVFMRILVAGVLLLLAAFVVLNTAGVPEPILREALRRVNASGVPVDVEKVTLTFKGWRADNVRYFSHNPDDLAPVFQAERLFFYEQKALWDTGSHGWKVHLRAESIKTTPALEWGVEIPAGSPALAFAGVEASVDFMPDRIRVTEGHVSWLGSRFTVNGSILRKEKETSAKDKLAKKEAKPAVEPRSVRLSSAQFQRLEDRLKSLSLPQGADVEIGFMLDADFLQASHLSIVARATALEIRKVGFSNAELAVRFAYPDLRVQRVALTKNLQTFELQGDYDVDSNLVQGSLQNTITSTQPLLALPEKFHELLVKLQLHISSLPRVELDFGPAVPKELLEHVSGTFSVNDFGYEDLQIESLNGKLATSEKRVDLTGLTGRLRGQEHRSYELNSSLHGGGAAGEVFWDAGTHEFGVDADIAFDPNLLMGSLSRVRIATNVIDRFKFKDASPKLHLKLGADITDWSSFFIDVSGTAKDAVIQGVECSSANVATFYKHGVLRIDPGTLMRSHRYLKGTASVDFKKRIARFDVDTTMNPASLENLIVHRTDLFKRHLQTGDGAVSIQAQGAYDWGTMKETDFTAAMEADNVRFVFARTDRFKAMFSGKGPKMIVSDMDYGLCGGTGQGYFVLINDPSNNAIPYTLDLNFTGVDFKEYIQSFNPDSKDVTVAGSMAGSLHFDADFSTNFFASARGKGVLNITEGQLADLPLFKGFSWLVRKMFPSFSVFSITDLRSSFLIEDGNISSDDTHFGGDIISADGRGLYNPETGFDAYLRVRVLSGTKAGTIMKILTYPVTRLLEVKLDGPFTKPSWRLKAFPKTISKLFSRSKE
ncbi:hypothetical protein [Pontiella sulfatireligans]|uniref:AsmA-like C-terminal domain-containing protein n=1 Tax=Pontiella sulfatireligans TaxID=2750658 RepID=A0A6C2UIT5_9BACT|nr:hypothetical protein [Pontiella sulfatireligans]VGO20132.1 hypothetical protein SCARR_02193 [Pontiella sulfatireligans]